MSRKHQHDAHDEMPSEQGVTPLFCHGMMQYDAWCNPDHGAVSPTLAEFFASCDPESDAVLNGARRLRIEHASDDGMDLLTAPVALALVETMVEQVKLPVNVATKMRQAVQEPRPWDNPLSHRRDLS